MGTTTEFERRGSRMREGFAPPGTGAASSPTPAVRGVNRGRVEWHGADDGRRLSSLLGWMSLVLGTFEVLAPRRLARMIGIEPDRRGIAVTRAMGIREMAHGLGILTNPRSKEWMATRIGGDALDLALLGVAFTRSERPERTLLATGAVLGVAALDVIGTEGLAERRRSRTGREDREAGNRVTRSITVARARSDVYAFWREPTNLPRFMERVESVEVLDDGRTRWRAAGPDGANTEWIAEIEEDRPDEAIWWRSVRGSDPRASGTVTFHDAPGGAGTTVTVEIRYESGGGKLGAAIRKPFRREAGQQVDADLRRFKQVMETGEVVVSDATAVPGPRPARPIGRDERRRAPGPGEERAGGGDRVGSAVRPVDRGPPEPTAWEAP